MATRTRLSLVSLLLTLAVGGPASAKVTENFERVVSFHPGGSFRIENQNGSIDVSTWSESNVKVVARKTARSEEALKDLEIVVEGSGDDVSVRTVHHRRWHGGFGGGEEVSYQVLLPVEARLTVKTANGEVAIDGIHGTIDAESVNGEVKIEHIEGAIEAETTNGSIHASYEKAADGRHRFETTNGSVRIYLPADAGGELDAETVNGSIDVDFPTTLVHSSRRHVTGSFGSGSSSFEVSTVNGSIKILSN